MIETSKENVAHDNGRRVGDVVECAEIPYVVSRIDDKVFNADCSIPPKYCELPDDVQFANCPDAEITFGFSGCSFGLDYNDHNYAVEYSGDGSPPLPSYEESIKKSPLALREIGTEDFQSPPTIPVRLRSQSVGGSTGVNVISQCSTSQAVIGSVIRCVCQYTHDDGKMVQCCKCSIWQHFDCLSTDEGGFDQKVSHECEVCNPRNIDYRRALEIQRKKRASCQTKSLHNSVLAQHVRRLSADPSKTHTIVVNASTVTSCPRQFVVTAVSNDKGSGNNVSTTASTSSNTTPASVKRVSKRKQTLAMRNTGSSPPDTTPCSAPLTPTGEDGTAVILSRGQADELLSSKLLTHPQGSVPSRPSGLPSPTRPQWHSLVSPPTIVGHPMNKCVPPGHVGGLSQSRPSYVYPLKPCHPSLPPRTNLNARSARIHRPSQTNLLSPTNTSLCNQRRPRDRCNSNFESSDIDDESDFSDHQSSPRMPQTLSGKTQKCDRDFRSNGKFVMCQRVIMRDEPSSMSSDEDEIWMPPKTNEVSLSLTAAIQQFRRTMTSWMQKEYQEADQMVYSNEVEKLLLKHNEHGIGENQADGRIRERLKLKHCRVIPLNTRLKLQKQNGEYQDGIPSAASSRPLSPSWRVLEATHSLRKYDTVIEFKGRMLLKSEYEKETDQTKSLNPFVLFYEGYGGPDLCLNASNYGNDARFIRRSCFPNCDIGHLTESGRLHLIVRALCDIPIGTELTIGFDFDYKQCPYVECACELTDEQCPVRQYTLSQFEIPNTPRQLLRPRSVYHRRKPLKPRLSAKGDELGSRKCEPSTSKMVHPRERTFSKSWYNRYNDYGSSLSPSETSLSSCTDASDIESSSIHVNTSSVLQVSSYDKDLEYDEILNADEIYEDSLRVSPSFNVRRRSISNEGKQDFSKGRKNMNAGSHSSSCSASDVESYESCERGVSPFRTTARQRSNQPPHSPRINAPSERTPVPSRVIGRQPRVKTTIGGSGHVNQRRFTDPLPKTPKTLKTYTPRRDSKSKNKLPGSLSARRRRESNDSRLSSASKDTETIMNETSHVSSTAGEDESHEPSTKEPGERPKSNKKKESEESENIETPRKMSRDDRWLAAVMRRIEEQEAGAKRKRSKTIAVEHSVTTSTSNSVNGEIKTSPHAQASAPITYNVKEEKVEFDDGSTDPMEDSTADISGVSDNEVQHISASISSRFISIEVDRRILRMNEPEPPSPLKEVKEMIVPELSTIKIEKVEIDEADVPAPISHQIDESSLSETKDINDFKSTKQEVDEAVVSCDEPATAPPETTPSPSVEVTTMPVSPDQPVLPDQPTVPDKPAFSDQPALPDKPVVSVQPDPPPTPTNRKRRTSYRALENEITTEKVEEPEIASSGSKDSVVSNEEPQAAAVAAAAAAAAAVAAGDKSKPDRWLRIALARIETEEKMIRRRLEREERRKKKQEKSEHDEAGGKASDGLPTSSKKVSGERDRSNSSIVENEEPCVVESQTDPVEVIVKEVDAETGESNPTSLGGVLESAPVSKEESVPQEISEHSLQQTPVSKRRRSNRRISPGNKSGDNKDDKPCSSTMVQNYEFSQNEDSSFTNDAKATVDSDSSSASLSSDEASQDEEDTRSSLLATSPASQLAGGRSSARQLRSSVGAIGSLDTPLSLTSRGRRGRPRRSSGGRGSVDCVTAPNVDTNDSSPGKNASEHCCDRIVYVNPSQKNPLERFARHKSQIDRPVTPQMETRDIVQPASEPVTPAPVPDTPTLGVAVCNLASTPIMTDTPAPLKKRWRNYKPIDRSPITNPSPQEHLLPPMKKRRLNFPSDDWQEMNSPKKSPMKLANELPPLEEESGLSRENKPDSTVNMSVSEDKLNAPLCAGSSEQQEVLEASTATADSPKLSTSGTETVDDSLPNHPISMPRKKLYLMHYEQEQLQMKLNEGEPVSEAVIASSTQSIEHKPSSTEDDNVREKEKDERTSEMPTCGETEGPQARLWSALIQFVKNPVTADTTAIAETNEEPVQYPEEPMEPPVGPRTPSEPDEGEDRAIGPGTPASAEGWDEERAQVSDHEAGEEDAEEDEVCDDNAADDKSQEDEEDEMLKEAQLLKRIHERDKQIMDMQELKSLERRKAKLEAQLRYIGKESAETTDNTRQEQGPTLNSTAVHNDIVRFTNQLKGHLERLKSQLNQPSQSGGNAASQLRDVMPSTSTDRDKSPSVNQDKPRSRSRSPLSQQPSHTKTPPGSDDDSSDSCSSNSSTPEQTRRHRHRHHGSHKKRRHHRSTHRHRHRSKHRRKHRRHRRDSTPNSSEEEITSSMNKGAKETDLANFETWEGLENDEEEVDSDDQMRYWNSESAMRRHYRDGGIRNCHFDDNIPESMSNDPYFDHSNAEAPPFVRRFPYPHFNPKMPPLVKNPEFHRTWHPGLRGGPGNRYRRRRPFMRHGPAPAAAPMPGQWETLPSPGLQHHQSVSSLPLQSQSVQQQPHQLPTQPLPPPQQQPQQQQPSLPTPQPGRGRPGGRVNRGIGGRHRGVPGLHRGAIGPSAANIRQYYGGNLASHRNWHHSMY